MVKRLAQIASAVGIVAMTMAPAGAAAPGSGGYSLFGDAQIVQPGNNSPNGAQTRSDPAIAPGYGGVDFGSAGVSTFADLQNLSTDYKFTSNSCGGGSPRFGVDLITPTGIQTVFIYIGPAPSYTGCPPNVWLNTGNLANPANLVDTSHLTGGTFYDPYAVAQTKYGSYPVNDIFLVTDASWFFGNTAQTVVFDNVMINNATVTFENGNSCKNGGWQQFSSSPGPFKNQGDCVSYFATGGKNKGNG